jgi:hypothetical protein
MSPSTLSLSERHGEVRRLVQVARTLLLQESEEIVGIYLDHALAALEDLDDASLPASPSG